jgi:hypothetical protein
MLLSDRKIGELLIHPKITRIQPQESGNCKAFFSLCQQPLGTDQKKTDLWDRWTFLNSGFRRTGPIEGKPERVTSDIKPGSPLSFKMASEKRRTFAGSFPS